ncbi:MAG: hypothetical protein ACKOFG_07470 [Limnohabitans sp.]
MSNATGHDFLHPVDRALILRLDGFVEIGLPLVAKALVMAGRNHFCANLPCLSQESSAAVN